MDDGLGGLTDAELAGLSAGVRVDLLLALERQRRRLEAAQLRVLAVMQERDDSELGLTQEEVSLALQLPLRTAQTRLAQAATVARELPATLAAVGAGVLSGAHAAVLAEAVWRLPAGRGLAAALEATVLPSVLAGGCVTVPQFRRRVRRAVLSLDPAGAERRHQLAMAERRVEYRPAEDGMASLTALLPAPEAQLLYARLTAVATLLPSADPRSLDQQRADLIVDGLLSGLPHDGLPQVQGRRPAIQVVVAADTLLGLDDRPAHLTGYGPVTAQTARRLAAEGSGTWRRLLTERGTGTLLDIGERRYRPAQRLRDFVSARDDVCAFPTCNQPGYRCEYDHIVPFADGGRTRRDNLALTCRRHNRVKARTGWRYRHNPDGSFTWTTATGHSYVGVHGSFALENGSDLGSTGLGSTGPGSTDLGSTDLGSTDPAGAPKLPSPADDPPPF